MAQEPFPEEPRYKLRLWHLFIFCKIILPLKELDTNLLVPINRNINEQAILKNSYCRNSFIYQINL